MSTNAFMVAAAATQTATKCACSGPTLSTITEELTIQRQYYRSDALLKATTRIGRGPWAQLQ